MSTPKSRFMFACSSGVIHVANFSRVASILLAIFPRNNGADNCDATIPPLDAELKWARKRRT